MKGYIRYLWIALGLLTLALGTLGIFLPILPTVPFYIATVFCFAKGSPRLHRWFIGTELYKKHLQQFSETRAMLMRSKLTLWSRSCWVWLCILCATYFTRLILSASSGWPIFIVFSSSLRCTKKTNTSTCRCSSFLYYELNRLASSSST